jgi:ribosome-associated protein
VRDLVLPNSSVTVPERELEWTAVRASGPGGQNVNKVSTKVELRFDFEASEALSAAAKARLRALAEHRLDAEGRILITSQVARTQPKNLENARERLAELLAKALIAPKRRRPTRPSRAAKRARVDDKRVHSKKKQSRARKTNDD